MNTTANASVRTNDEVKSLVREKYGAIAEQANNERPKSCGCSTSETGFVNEDYSQLAGYAPEADLALGCGIPTSAVSIVEGATVLDLGSGAGNDAFVARRLVGAAGKVIGVDMTPAMVRKARENAQRLGFNNVEFREGDIENLPVTDGEADVVVSNCVLNLVPDKAKAFAELYRALKPGGHFGISDMVLKGELPPALLQAAEMYVGCVAGAMQKDDYLAAIRNAGFINARVTKERTIDLPDEVLLRYVTPEALSALRASGAAVLSITVYGEKPNVATN